MDKIELQEVEDADKMIDRLEEVLSGHPVISGLSAITYILASGIGRCHDDKDKALKHLKDTVDIMEQIVNHCFDDPAFREKLGEFERVKPN